MGASELGGVEKGGDRKARMEGMTISPPSYPFYNPSMQEADPSMPPTRRMPPHGTSGDPTPLRPIGRHQRLRSTHVECRSLSFARSAPCGLMSHLPDEVGRRGSARHDSSARSSALGAINCLHRALADGTCLEAATPANKEAPQWPRGLCRLPRHSNLTPRLTSARAARPQNQPTLRSWVRSH
jgi:hypothetical protein